MKTKRPTHFGWRLVALIGVLTLLAAACESAADETTTTTAPDTTPTTEPPPEGYAMECPADPYAGVTTPEVVVLPREIAEGEGVEPVDLAGSSLGTYRTGIFQANTAENVWAYQDTLSTVWNGYVLNPTTTSLFGIASPGLELTNNVAASAELPLPEADGAAFSVTVDMRTDAVWSDGQPITANDIVFTAETVRDLALGGNWLGQYAWVDPEDPDRLGLTNVEAVNDSTVKFTWNLRPGLPVWPHQAGTAIIMPQHHWADAVAEAALSDDPRAALYASDLGSSNPSGGTTIFSQREEGAFTRMVANNQYFDAGREISSGGAEYTEGPWFGDVVYTQYGDQSAAVLALRAGEVDFLFNPLGMQRGLLDQVISDENLTAITNATNGFRYMGFNLRQNPSCWNGFRDAVAFMIDKEFMANSVLQGVAFPLYATVPEGNTFWYNPEVAAEFAASITGLELDTRHDGEPFVDDEGEPRTATGGEARLHAAVAALKADGFTWDVEPDFANAAIVPGVGIRHGGLSVKPLEIVAPGPGYDPLRSTYSVWIADWLNGLGFDARAFNTDFDTLVDVAFNERPLTFDLFLLGWSLGNPALPGYHESFWAGKNDTMVNDGNNSPGFNHPGFNELVEMFNAAETLDEAYAIMWEMEKILFEYKPYILLFDTGIIEFYRHANVAYPFTRTLSGLQFVQGLTGGVQAR